MAIGTLVRCSSNNNTGNAGTGNAAAPSRGARRTEAPARRAARRQDRVDVARLEQVEEQLLVAAIENHPRRDAALDRLADDLADQTDDLARASAEVERAHRSPLLLRSAASLNRMEELMLEAVVRTHPNRDRALDRLLDDVAGDAVTSDPVVWQLPEHFVDNDFDGMG